MYVSFIGTTSLPTPIRLRTHKRYRHSKQDEVLHVDTYTSGLL